MSTAFLPHLRTASINMFGDADFAAVLAFFAARPDLEPTPLRTLPDLARRVGVGALLAKDETSRFGLNAFKAVGTTFAVSSLCHAGRIRPGDTLVCASEGNHGRAVARAARTLGLAARVYLSESVSDSRVDAIRNEGALAVLVPGDYDTAVRVMAREAATHGWRVISDTSWEGYSEIPRLIMLGYTHLMTEAEHEWSPGPPDVVFVPAGVGGLLASVASWCHWRFGSHRPRIVAVEPLRAASVMTSVQNGRPTPLPGPFETALAGLRCGEMSPDVFPTVSTSVDAFVAIEDEWAFDGMRRLARPSDTDPSLRCGASGAAALGALLALMSERDLRPARSHLGLGPDSRVLVLLTEGVTDPALFERVLTGG